MNIVTGNLLAHDAACIVNPWNMNVFPHWLLLPAGVSRQLKKAAGPSPFRELARHGRMRPGSAVLTSGGRLNKPLIHVAGLNLLWRSTEAIVFRCTAAALALADSQGFASMAMPLIGAGTGGLSAEQSLRAIRAAAASTGSACNLHVVLWDGSDCP
ncbi:Appr-1-p processing protein [Pantoea rodasii]|uniref:Appr-1-p processing protein n=1 Tax=Pantoea rodasii TaxID=1076549 RepID=A0A2M9W5Q6_9GAMM|nr:macro domain-containing protein [Pantoea rodasii]ORM61613.1 hypothetical protein HA45_20315 [Pantoea rodasii]PJZ02880.1 Appr-1-p processing protein [Pantoea rodasii]